MTTLSFAFVLSISAAYGQQVHNYRYDDRERSQEPVQAINMDVPGTQVWHAVSNKEATDVDDQVTKVRVTPLDEDMGSVQVQIMVAGRKPCTRDKRETCELWEIAWTWISHLKQAPYPMVCRLQSTSPGIGQVTIPEITPGKGPQELEFHTIGEYEYGVNPPEVPMITRMPIQEWVRCVPVGEPDLGHHKCNAGEIDHCISGKTIIKKSPSKRTASNQPVSK